MTTPEKLETRYRFINGGGRLEERVFDVSRYEPVVQLQMWEKHGHNYIPQSGGSEAYVPVSSLLSLLEIRLGKGANKNKEVAQAAEVAQLKQALTEANRQMTELTERVDEMERARVEAEERHRRSLAVLST